MSLDTQNRDDLDLELVLAAADINQQVVAESLLDEAGIPFESRRVVLQDLYGSAPQLGGVKILVPAEHVAAARQLLAGGIELAPAEIVGEAPVELTTPAVAEDPQTVRARRLALASMVFSLFIFAPVGLALGLWALFTLGDAVPKRWRFLAVASILVGVVGVVELVLLSIH